MNYLFIGTSISRISASESAFTKISHVKPGILMNPNTFIILIGRKNLLQSIMTVGNIQGNLIISWSYVFLIWKNPNLQEFYLAIFIFIVFAVKYPIPASTMSSLRTLSAPKSILSGSDHKIIFGGRHSGSRSQEK